VLKDFKDFLLKGNLLEIAIGLILALAFKTVVDSLVNDIIMQIVAAIGGQPDFSSLAINVGDGRIRYGAFLTAILSFIIIGFVLFVIVKAYNRAVQMAKRGPDEDATEPGEDVLLLREIRDSLRARG